MKTSTSSPIKPVKKATVCANCGVPKGRELLCPVCHSIGPLYLFEWILLLVTVLVIVLVILSIIVLVGPK